MNKILKVVHCLITEDNSNEVRLSGRFGIVITIIVCCVGLLICSDGRAEDIKCATVTAIETGEAILSCFDIETEEYVDCTQKQNAKKCHLEVLENY